MSVREGSSEETVKPALRVKRRSEEENVPQDQASRQTNAGSEKTALAQTSIAKASRLQSYYCYCDHEDDEGDSDNDADEDDEDDEGDEDHRMGKMMTNDDEGDGREDDDKDGKCDEDYGNYDYYEDDDDDDDDDDNNDDDGDDDDGRR